jgi:hypothetical protein
MYQDNTDAFLMYLLYAVAFIVSIFITRAIFSIPKFLRYQRAQIKLMALVAHQNGIAEERIQKILRESDGSTDETSLEFVNKARAKGEAKEIVQTE